MITVTKGTRLKLVGELAEHLKAEARAIKVMVGKQAAKEYERRLKELFKTHGIPLEAMDVDSLDCSLDITIHVKEEEPQ